MSKTNYKSVCILGRLPGLGIAELERLYGQNIKVASNAALLEIAAEDIEFSRLGGTIKVARILTILPTTNWKDLIDYLIDKVPDHLQYLDPGKFTFGLSAYGFSLGVQEINKDVLKIKKAIKNSGRSVRVVPNKSLELNSAQVLHNKLTHKGSWELIFIKDKEQTILAQTLFVQDIDAYAARDQARPKRDSRVGMLPPKLAQTIINLAVGERKEITILDPFCGTGVLLQEALIMGYGVVGTDIEEKMIEYSRHNLKWLEEIYPKTISSRKALRVADATNTKWLDSFNIVACEAFLGRPLSSLPERSKLNEIIQDANTIIRKFLVNLNGQIDENVGICIAVPAWRNKNGSIIHLPLIDHLTDLGYNRLDLINVSNADLIYSRENQTVARELLILRKVKQ